LIASATALHPQPLISSDSPAYRQQQGYREHYERDCLPELVMCASLAQSD